MKLNYIVIPLLTILVAVCSTAFSRVGLKRWYKKLELPDLAPPGQVIGVVWAIIYTLSTIAALIVWNSSAINHDESLFVIIFLMFGINAVMNIFWSFVFFNLRMIGLAAWESGALALSVLALILLTLPISAIAAALLVPYLVWSCFATYLNYKIWQLNK